MRAEDLVALASARGIDLIQAARTSAKNRRVPKLVRLTDQIVGGRLRAREGYIMVADGDHTDLVANRARGRSTRSTKKPQYTLVELGMAAQGVPEIEFQAVCYAYAGSDAYLWRLHAELTKQGLRIQKRDRWPEFVKDIHGLQKKYVEHLAKLVLDEDRHGYSSKFFAVGDLAYAVYLGVEEKTWLRELAPRLNELQFIWHGWLGNAARLMQKQLSAQ